MMAAEARQTEQLKKKEAAAGVTTITSELVPLGREIEFELAGQRCVG
jgi:hypothetical protein